MAWPLSLRAPPTPRIGPQREPAKSYIRHNHMMLRSGVLRRPEPDEITARHDALGSVAESLLFLGLVHGGLVHDHPLGLHTRALLKPCKNSSPGFIRRLCHLAPQRRRTLRHIPEGVGGRPQILRPVLHFLSDA